MYLLFLLSFIFLHRMERIDKNASKPHVGWKLSHEKDTKSWFSAISRPPLMTVSSSRSSESTSS